MSDQPTGDDRNLLNYIASTVEMIRDRMATKDDIARLDSRIDSVEARMATKDDLNGVATKEDLARVEARLDAKIDGVEARLSEKIGVEITAVRGDIEQVHLRLNGIDRAISSRLDHVEADMSRLRSVLYLLVKDDPDMLRMLGYAPPGGA